MWLLSLMFCCVVFAFDDVVSNCGGFVKPSQALTKVMETKVDVSNIKVHLVTQEGQLKYTTDCAPNGYYIIPVYDKGTYKIRIAGPKGWAFDVAEHVVHIGATQTCTNNFELTGFEVSGKVASPASCASSDVPQDGVTVSLTSVATSETRKVLTSNGGYSFENVFPGSYTVSVSHPTWTFQETSVPLSVSWGNTEVEKKFIVVGYDISGSVTEGDGDGVSSVHFLLYTSSPLSSYGCSKISPDQIQKLERGDKHVCGATSGSDGKWQILNVPCGTYTLVPFYADEFTTFDVIPKEEEIKSIRGSVVIDTPFKVKGFSVRGKVTNSNGEGIPGVTITVPGLKDAISGPDGTYRLNEVSSGLYKLKASKPHHVFSEFKEPVKITPNTPELPVILATHYYVCGSISIPQPPSGVSVVDRDVIVSQDGVEKQRGKTDKQGNYCIALKSGKYSITPAIQQKETEAGLLLSSTEANIVVDAEPLLDINFNQARLTVSGQVRCIESPCHNSISVSLSAVGRPSRVTTGLAIAHDETSHEDYFVFKDVLPGKYEISINQDNWCWDKEKQGVEVMTKDHSETSFVQKGYLVVVSSSHDIELKAVEQGTGQEKTVQVVKGRNQFCLENPGKYDLIPVSCYQFSQEKYTYLTSTPQPVSLTAEKYKIEGRVIVAPGHENEDLHITITNTNTKESTNIKPTPVPGTPNTFSYALWGRTGDNLAIVPSGSLFFYPRSLSFSLEQNICHPLLPNIEARAGFYLKGSVSPGVEGVSIHVYQEGKEEGEPLLSLKTDSAGKYAAGPLYDDISYSLKATHPDYYVKANEGSTTDFRLLKMGRLHVFLKDKDGKGVSGALLSLTSSDGYINNNVTDIDGIRDFGTLFPGEYYIKPLLKEYVFVPAALSVTLVEGENQKLVFDANRVAFSCFGNIKTLNGQPAKSVSVEAVGPNKYEETKTDPSGNFRLRGLEPGVTYTIQTKLSHSKESDGLVDRAEPQSMQVTIREEDVQHVDFITFLKENRWDLMGSVFTPREYLDSLTLRLQVQGRDGSEEYSLGPHHFFTFPNLDLDPVYTLTLTTTLSAKDYEYQLPSITLNLKENATIATTPLNISFPVEVRKLEEKMDNGPFFTLLFVCAIAACIYYRKPISVQIEKFKNRSVKPDPRKSNWDLDANNTNTGFKTKKR